ncbi:MAG: crosslink repair DNA glycosylase YcaQ family protein [Amylibacter sp.]
MICAPHFWLLILRITNKQARALWLHTNGLSSPQTGPADPPQIITDLGFVQIDTIRNITHAHYHILWLRNANYREIQLWPLLGKDRSIFEHFTHDASLIPMEFYLMWAHQFRRMGEKVA